MTRSISYGSVFLLLWLGVSACSDPERQNPGAFPGSGSGGSTSSGNAGSDTGGSGGAAGSVGSGDAAGGAIDGAPNPTPPVDASATGSGGAADGSPPPSGQTGSGGAVGSGGAAGAGGFSGSGGGLTLPVTVTAHYIPSGWFGDAETMAAFTDAARVPIKLIAPANDGPCAARVSGSVGQCMKVTYSPIVRDGGAVGYAGVALLGPAGQPAHRIAQGARIISARVAGAVGGERVDFTFGNNAADGFSSKVISTLTTTWQEVSYSLAGVPYDRIANPFTWGSESPAPITFYYDNVQIK